MVGGLKLCDKIDNSISPDKDETAMLKPFAQKIMKVMLDADQDKQVWQSQLAEGVGNTFGLDKKRHEGLEKYISRVLLQFLVNEVDIGEDAVLGGL